jgi:glycosyltransferase involved in cell wall biosynthesis
MRIGLVTADFWPNVGGVAAHVVELGRALVQQGHVVHVLTRPLREARLPRSTYEGMHVHRPPLTQLRPLSSWALHRWLREFLRREPLDLLHVHGLRPMRAVRRLPCPIVFTNHTSGFLRRMERGRFARRRVARMLAPAQLVLAPSEELATSTRTLGLNVPVHYIPNGVNPDRFSPIGSSMRERLGIAQNATVVLLARRLVAKNGVCVFAQAVPQFLRPGVRVLFAGDGPERAEVENILEEAGCRGAALFLGDVPNVEMPTVYRAANISVLPSFLEATSITGLESMATALPLVGTRVGGIPALIDHEQTGLLVDPGSPGQLAAAVNRLLDAPELRRSYGAAGRAKIEREFAWEVIARRTAACYEQLLRDETASGDEVRTLPLEQQLLPGWAPSREAA